ncbi:hypothetical protein [Actinocatenispora rupis]|uniref:Fe-S cluster assembly iron-binding protein IscA n=1 Tax=Actinocatenispora rupis TaxID=519421 RepID=A0A8J3J6Q2_9ACTN|nr:hypothetical protein [Actinocatenispora rupis]GID11202.1 hypothetical protein Aru02nite_20910 [Actinocatenispora rupis]
MLALTENAVAVIRTLTEQTGDPTGAGLRIAADTVPDDTAEAVPDDAHALTLAVTQAPESGDQVLDADGARLFLESGAAAYLDDKALDAEVDQNGNVSFAVALRPE